MLRLRHHLTMEINDLDVNITYDLDITNINNVSVNNFNCIYLNIRSLRNKLDDILLLLSSFNKTIHVLMLVETWLVESEKTITNIPGYNSIHSVRKDKIGGGVSIFVKDNLIFNSVYENVLDNNNILIISLPEQKVHICGIYNNPRSIINNFFVYFNNIMSTYKNLLIFGDLNLNILNFNDNTVREYNELIQSNGFLILNKAHPDYATRISNTIKTILDHIITDKIQSSYKFFISSTHLSDHEILALSFEKPIKKIKPINKKIIIDYDNIKSSNAFQYVDNCSSFDELIEFIKSILEKNRKTIKMVNSKIKNPWISKSIIASMKKRDFFYELKKKFPFDEYIYENFLLHRNKVSHLVKNAKQSYYSNLLDRNTLNLKKTWSIINELIFNKKRANQPVQTQLKTSNSTSKDPQQCANIFNDYFVSAAENLVQHLPRSNDYQLYMQRINTSPNKFDFAETSSTEILKIINNLKISTAVGHDEISSKFVQHFAAELSPTLARLVNTIIAENSIPEILKVSRVLPIYKSGDKLDVSNYRGISIFTPFAKVVEIVLQNRLKIFLQENKIIHPLQFGFTEKSNTTAATLQLISTIQENLDKGQRVACLLIDLSKAFDCVDRILLVEKLKMINFSEKSVALIKSYFECRKQFVQLGEIKSDLQYIQKGVPQGSNNGPIFFNIYINDLFNLPLNGCIQLYADDLALVYSATDLIVLENQLQSDMDIILKWCNDNLLQINFKKCQVLVFDKRNFWEDSSLTISAGNTTIENVKSAKYLGLTIDSKLNFHEHINQLIKSLNPMIFAIRRARNNIKEKSAWLMYHSFIYSRLLYVNPVWNCVSLGKINALQILQNTVIKCIKRLPRLHPTVNLYTADILPLVVLNDYEILLCIFKIKNNLLKCVRNLTLINNLHDYPTRSNSDFFINTIQSKHGFNNVFHRGPILFNSLPDNIKKQERISIFKKLTKEYLFNKFINQSRN